MKNGNFGQILPAMTTPFDADGAINWSAVEQLVAFLLENGSDGIVVCGTTGESPTLSSEEKLALFRKVKELVGNRGTVVAGTSSYDTKSAITLSRAAADVGVDGVLLVVPPYNKPSQEGLYQHFRTIAESVPETRCMLYNVPGRTVQNMDASTAVRLANDVANIVATKEASGNLVQAAEIYRTAPEGFAMYSGEDGLTLPLLAVGAIGTVSVTSHLVGKDYKRMIQAFFEGNYREAADLNAKMLPIVRACFQSTTPSPAPLKAALNMLGIPVGGLRLPLVEANEQEKVIVRNALQQYGLI